MEPDKFEKSSINEVKRYRNRGKYGYDDVYPIIDSAPVLHISFHALASDATESYPVILPMFGCTGSYGEKAGTERSIYLHGYVSSRFFKKSSNSLDDSDGLKICVAATLMDGLVLALTPNHHSCNYRSAIAFGDAHLVTDEGERFYAMELITNNILPERWENTRIPPTRAELTATGIIRVDIKSASAKVRAGTTGEDRNDLKDEEMRRRVWAGVIPSWTQWGSPIPAPTNMVENVPDYIRTWVKDANASAEKFAYDVAK
ncbi:hypothetical protein L228DRAFT_284860 [Xylona heveae TC161]|uniref:Flavin-nucleotide-binding protein n=1 Tax=Xylona heveae (strain CBS 132557 / TC161) TaxID=1328760 RepID=A0A165FGQ2_XYLHT|nr:hypothetical protein L228DRAFT_284860 [Xylona heveae TC161]KZF20956.1 hypothetical protein L228DRAFT_284860 [Xylona heveae TC161]